MKELNTKCHTELCIDLPEKMYISGIKQSPNTLYVKAENVIIQDKTLGFEINLTKRIKGIDKLVIDGITFIKEK